MGQAPLRSPDGDAVQDHFGVEDSDAGGFHLGDGVFHVSGHAQGQGLRALGDEEGVER